MKSLVNKILLISFFIFVYSLAYSNDIVIVYPFDNMIVNDSQIHIIGYVSQKDKVEIISNKNLIDIKNFQKLKTKDGLKYVFMTKVNVDKGINEINVKYKQNNISLTVKYLTSAELYRDKIKRKTYFHLDENKSLCVSCHNFKKIKDCQVCHSDKMNYTYVHGPAAAWQCFQCHDKNNYFAPKQPISSICLQCHEEFRNNMFNAPYAHGPTVAGYCNICHDSHGSNRKYLLNDKINNLCINCHSEKKSGVHVLANFTSSAHPTSGKKIPGTKEEISCVSCHNPHYGESKQLFQNGVKDFMILCTSCHKDKL
ncbi:multiheme c-type cytochrome [Deferribacter desulfuricans SSM1]|uniref:Multiheme c-type cytochrome n=1 Tax=Deferribacter desulfuricans (strain DSM 14783 / JCM 11476 / NBRC 101012 / SSM1) TaxID=639282 RepID=D3PCA5_DEFDS|nr:multiheme c-type cytochrome [Deferribacter desulfuricans SSM1]